MRHVTGICLLTAGAFLSQAQADLASTIEAAVRSEMISKGVPGVSAAVMRDGKMVLERGWGLADIEKNAAASAATTYPVASVTKQFTAALLLKQVDRGRLVLNDPIGKHIAGLTPETGAVTIEQLLNHTSGLPSSVSTPERRHEKVSVETLLSWAVRQNPVNPGTKWEYSNAGYTVLGVLVERLYGKPFAAALRDEIAAPLGLTTLTMCVEPVAGEATGYYLAGTKPSTPPGLHYSQSLGPGGICSNAGDLVRWTHALHTGRVLSDASYQAMTTPRGAAASVPYGFGLSLRPAVWGQKRIAHDGQSFTGHTSDVQWYPEQKLAVALLTNAGPRPAGMTEVVRQIVVNAAPEKKM